MVSLIPSWPYPPSREGYWGHVSSTINWCEEVRDSSQKEIGRGKAGLETAEPVQSAVNIGRTVVGLRVEMLPEYPDNPSRGGSALAQPGGL